MLASVLGTGDPKVNFKNHFPAFLVPTFQWEDKDNEEVIFKSG